ncbi:STAS domain-containing protein [Cellulophaga tyrosinoxydans]|uniref:STAS domain-containing protein n=1 Tax=Cellulophaga tyrosinoxydans TaxID=504486 RepID=A0A1W2A3V8_9FLAO|nr:STAS domain-containing protein [Cellulophaga tyrosinoxydans]SMC55429.1 STAS domain-containing protein [Cellulophaga tyrosinoxydans]
MALQIQENYGIHSVIGHLGSQNISHLRNHIQKLMTVKDSIMISIENVTSIDTSAAKSLEVLYKEAASKNIVLSIFGKQNQKIQSSMMQSKTHYILSSDRV